MKLETIRATIAELESERATIDGLLEGLRRLTPEEAVVMTTVAAPHPGPMASQARHESVAPQETNAARSVVPAGRGEGEADPAVAPGIKRRGRPRKEEAEKSPARGASDGARGGRAPRAAKEPMRLPVMGTRSKPGTVIMVDAIRILAGQKPKVKFKRDEMGDRIGAKFPHLVKKMATQLPVTLIDLVERGELSRTGMGREAVYTVVKLKDAGGRTHGQPAMRRPMREFVAPAEPAPKSVTGEEDADDGKPVKAPSEKEKRWEEMRGTISVPRDLGEE